MSATKVLLTNPRIKGKKCVDLISNHDKTKNVTFDSHELVLGFLVQPNANCAAASNDAVLNIGLRDLAQDRKTVLGTFDLKQLAEAKSTFVYYRGPIAGVLYAASGGHTLFVESTAEDTYVPEQAFLATVTLMAADVPTDSLVNNNSNSNTSASSGHSSSSRSGRRHGGGGNNPLPQQQQQQYPYPGYGGGGGGDDFGSRSRRHQKKDDSSSSSSEKRRHRDKDKDKDRSRHHRKRSKHDNSPTSQGRNFLSQFLPFGNQQQQGGGQQQPQQPTNNRHR